jgi:hypothetical protein
MDEAQILPVCADLRSWRTLGEAQSGPAPVVTAKRKGPKGRSGEWEQAREQREETVEYLIVYEHDTVN